MVSKKSKSSKKQVAIEANVKNNDIEMREEAAISPREEKKEEAEKTRIESIEKEASENGEKENEKKHSESSAADEESEDEGVWDIIRIIPTAEEKIECRYEGCSAQAVATWATDTKPEDKWSLCESCQLKDFGGWPEGVEPVERSKDIVTNTMKDCTDTPKENNDGSFGNTKEEIVTDPDESDPNASEAKYELVRIIPYEKLLSSPIKCSGCNVPACSVWTSTSDPKKWYYCVDCQEKDFGGWPPSNELPCDFLPPEHLRVIAMKCSKKRKPAMPVFASTCATPPPSKDTATLPAVVSIETKRPISKVSRAAVARHEKWQADAKKLGVNRIIVKKNEAKKVIFDALYDAFRPMNIEDIYLMLKKMIPLPVLKATLSGMSTDWQDEELFEGSDDDENGGKTAKKASDTNDIYTGSVYFKAGRSAASSLYYVDHNKIKEMNSEERRDLLENVATTNAEFDQLTLHLKQLDATTTKLLAEPTNAELIERLSDLENDVSILEENVNDARALTVNESHKNKLKRRIQSMAGHYRKRKQLCCSFLSSLEEISDGTISKKKCLKGDGQIPLDSDESVNKAAIAYAKSKGFSKVEKSLLADENFVGVVLDSQQMVKRVYVDQE